jgi:Fe-S cluster assembly iron-binding protein IscA
MLNVTASAKKQFKVAAEQGELGSSRVRVFVDHRCHCGKAHFSLALDGECPPDHTAFEVDEIPFVADADTARELPLVEIDFVETVWTKGFTVRNTGHDCGKHMMD